MALWQAKNADRVVNLSALASELSFEPARMFEAYTALDRYRYTRQKGVSSEQGLPYPLKAELTQAGAAAAAKFAQDRLAPGTGKYG